jgi:hypothetical protein
MMKTWINLGGCLALAAAMGAGACATQNPDADGDGVRVEDDRCPESDSSLPADEEGCTNADDTDGDGVPNDQDLCPETANADSASVDGCDADQVDEEGNPLEEPAAFRTFVVDAQSETPMVLRAKSNTVVDSPEGVRIEGTILVSTPIGHLKMLEASIELTFVSGSDNEVDTIVGTAGVPFPDIGAMSVCEMEDLARATVGLDYGANLEDLGAPLADDRRYLFFQLNAGLSAQCGPIAIEAPGGADALAVLDPSDPMMYLEGSLLGLGAIGPVESVGLGISAQGLMPFHPAQVLTEVDGLDGLGDFDGHLYVKGSGNIYKALTLDGEMMLSFNKDGGGIETFGESMQIGANGALGVSVDFLPFASFGFGLGEATVVGHTSEGSNYAYISGELSPDTSWLPSFVPVVPEVNVRVEGLISDDIESSFIAADGMYKMDLAPVGDALGIELNVMESIEGSLDMNSEVGIEFHGVSQRSFTPFVDVAGDVQVHGSFGNPSDWYIEMSGAMSVGGVGLAGNSRMRLSNDGLIVTGAVDTGIASIEVIGQVTSSGLTLRGEAGTSIDLVAGKAVAELVVDGALCGFKVVSNGAVCGFETVTSAAICGTKTVTSAAICGTKVVTSAAVCGVETFSCWLNPFNWGSCTEAKSCTQISTCTVADSCANFNAPKTCTDFGRPLTCEKHSILPDFDFGQFNGHVALELGTSGLRGEVSGEYCIEGNCATLADGYVKVGNTVEACIDLSLGEFCARI